MKVFAFILCVGYLALLAHGISDEDKQHFRSLNEECQSNPATRLDKEMIEKLRKHEEVDKKQLRAYSLCMTKKLGIQKENGDVDKEALKKTLAKAINDETKLNKLVGECGARRDTIGETAEEIMRCFHEHIGRHMREHGEHHDSDEHHDH
nr:odorant binding protein [Semanotus bifasciatus]